MKTIVRTMLLMAVVAVVAVAAQSCSADGDHLYEVTVSDDTSPESIVAYKASGAQSKIMSEVGKVGTVVDNSGCVILNGKGSTCDRLLTETVGKAMDEIEEDKNYNKEYYLAGVTVEIRAREDEVLLSRTFKK